MGTREPNTVLDEARIERGPDAGVARHAGAGGTPGVGVDALSGRAFVRG
jgi:hypothetical protein